MKNDLKHQIEIYHSFFQKNAIKHIDFLFYIEKYENKFVDNVIENIIIPATVQYHYKNCIKYVNFTQFLYNNIKDIDEDILINIFDYINSELRYIILSHKYKHIDIDNINNSKYKNELHQKINNTLQIKLVDNSTSLIEKLVSKVLPYFTYLSFNNDTEKYEMVL